MSGPRQAATWLAAKATEVKLRWDDRAGGALRLLEAVELVESGVQGKQALWRALAAAAEDAPGLRQADYAQLERRAEDQRSRLEGVRRPAARAALGGPPPLRVSATVRPGLSPPLRVSTAPVWLPAGANGDAHDKSG